MTTHLFNCDLHKGFSLDPYAFTVILTLGNRDLIESATAFARFSDKDLSFLVLLDGCAYPETVTFVRLEFRIILLIATRELADNLEEERANGITIGFILLATVITLIFTETVLER